MRPAKRARSRSVEMRMKKYDAREFRALFDRDENIIEWIKSREASGDNSATSILYAYDAQAGSYLAIIQDSAAAELANNVGRHLATVIDELSPRSLLEAGTGEATSLVPILRHMKAQPTHILGFDLSLSRLLFARQHLADNGNTDVVLFTGALDRIPLASASVDAVMTIHAVEPNGGLEDVILAELLRVARRHLIMIEPSYELASAEARARMERLGYVRGLPTVLERLGHPARRIERWSFNSNPLNEAVLIIVDKLAVGPDIAPHFVSPISGRKLVARQDCWFCPEDGHAFPIIAGIPCLTVENAVLASKLDRF